MQSTKRRNRAIKILLGIISLLIVVLIVNFIPTFNLKTSDMNMLSGEWVNV